MSDNATKVLRCPVCIFHGFDHPSYPEVSWGTGGCQIICDTCGFAGPIMADQPLAILNWNVVAAVLLTHLPVDSFTMGQRIEAITTPGEVEPDPDESYDPACECSDCRAHRFGVYERHDS